MIPRAMRGIEPVPGLSADSVRLGPAPRTHVDGGDYNTKHIGRDKAELCGADSDDTNDRAIHAR